ncbi:MAG: ABC transporter permease [Chloroflexi bacterium]|nr:ABC transporter permease [Chloroflexota bacterium]MDL1942901.1 ABC transporter permease [Chloroflexi bacterium CFX2]
MAVTVVIGLYLTILIANMGGYVDQIRRGEIRETIQLQVMNDPSLKSMTAEQRIKLIEDRIVLEEKRLGLDKPFAVRSFAFLKSALVLDLGFAQYLNSDTGSKQVRLIILERLPSTLVLFGTTNLLLFFATLFAALYLSRRYGSFLDKAIVALSPMSAAPAWFYGIFLILIFAAGLKLLPFGGMVDAPPPDNTIDYALSLLRHMTLPAAALALNSVAYSIYAERTFFLIYSSEDYVEMAKAKGLTAREVESRYILRPTLPTIITNFAFLLIGVWTGAPIFEGVFNWPGLGRTTVIAVGLYDTPVIVGTTVIFSYLLAVTVFLLDFVYALVDPRVKIGSEGGAQ